MKITEAGLSCVHNVFVSDLLFVVLRVVGCNWTQ